MWECTVKLRQKIIAATASLALALMGVTMVTPAHAAVSSVTVADCDAATLNSQTFNVPDGDNLQINFTTCAGLTIAGTFSGTFNSGWSNGIDTFGYDSTPRSFSGFGIPAPNTPLSAGSTVIYFRNTNTSGSGNADGSFTIVVGSGGGGSSSSAAAEPQIVEISLTPEDGTTCRHSSQPGTAGTWMSLPGADDCTPPASKAGATLLGWATSPNFPVAIAKRQVDNGWGAYETFNDEGQLTGVFIPAGGATFLSGAGKLYTIWSE
jgi:hypothetical protein